MRDKELLDLLVTQTWNLYREVSEGNKIEVKNLAKKVADTIAQNKLNPVAEGLQTLANQALDAAQSLSLTAPAANKLYQLALKEQLKLDNQVRSAERTRLYSNGPVTEGTLYQLAGKYLKVPPPREPVPPIQPTQDESSKSISGLGNFGGAGKCISLILVGILLGSVVFLGWRHHQQGRI